MNTSSILGFLLTSLLLARGCNGLTYDIQVSEIVDGKEVSKEENEIFIEDSYVTPEPPSIILDSTEDGEFILEEVDGVDNFVGREIFNITDFVSEQAFKKEESHVPEEHMNFQFAFGTIGETNFEWSKWSCCRYNVNIQSRERVMSPRIELEYRRCNSDFCPPSDCKDSQFVCSGIIARMGSNVCSGAGGMSSIMSRHCPRTCGFCTPSWIQTTPPRTRPVVTTRPWWQPTTRRPTTQRPAFPTINRNMVKVTVLTHNRHPPYPSYKFVLGDAHSIRSPWRRIPQHSSEVSSFYLYSKAVGIYNTALNFCTMTDRNSGIERWTVLRRNCGNSWTPAFVLYAARSRSKDSQLYYLGNRGKPYWTAKVSKSPSNGYTNGLFYFYGPTVRDSRPSTPRPRLPFPTTPRPFPTTTRQPFPTATRRPFLSLPTTTRRPSVGTQPRNAYNKECLDAHNLFRAVHNVPLLKWSPELARTAQGWADQLKMIAPERPDQLKMPHLRTRNWPHSDSGKGFRNRGDGENIAWDLSDDGSPAKESVMRWYAEIFYYDRQNPTRAPGPNKPVGHLTQLLWKDTTHLGCGVSTTDVKRQGYSVISTWSVSHYSPGGNMRYSNSPSLTLKLYNEQVPDMRQGSCMTKSGLCNDGTQCMAFGHQQAGIWASCNCNSGRPICRGQGGCIANCKNRNRQWPWKDECQGVTECKCTDKGAECK